MWYKASADVCNVYRSYTKFLFLYRGGVRVVRLHYRVITDDSIGISIRGHFSVGTIRNELVTIKMVSLSSNLIVFAKWIR